MKKNADPANAIPVDHIAVAFDQKMFAHGSREILLAEIATDAAKKTAARRKKPSVRQKVDERPPKGSSDAIVDANQSNGTESGEPASVANTAQENPGAAYAETGNAPLPAPLAAFVHLVQNTTGDTLTDADGLDATTPGTIDTPPVAAIDTESSRIGLLETLLGGLGVAALGLAVTREKGSEGSGNAAIPIDNPPPTATLKIFAGLIHDSATVWSSENGTAYLVHKSVAVSTLADITGAADTLWNKVEVTANTDTALSLVGLLPHGGYRLYFVDAAGNLSPTVVDTGTVDSNVVPPSLALASDTGSSNSDSITNIGTVNVNELESGATWEYLVDGGNWIPGSGSSFTANPGHHSYVVRQTDKAGHTISISSIITCELDTTAPAIPSLLLASDTGGSNSDGITRYATIIVSGLEVDTSWEYQMDNGNWTPGDSWTPGGNRLTASAGSHTYAIRQTDLAGNTSLSPSVTYTLDNTAPTCTITDDIGGTATATDVPTFSFIFSEAVTHFTAGDITLSAGTQGVFSKIDSSHYTLTVTPPSGLGTMSVDVTTGSFDDLAGNANTADTTADAQRYSTQPSTLDLGTASFGDIASAYVALQVL